MKVQDCSTGQQVIHKESGKIATIRRIYGSSGEVELAFENGTTVKVHVRLVDPAASTEADATGSGPQRPCPQCAAKMPADATVCPACGFTYGVKSPKPPRRLMKSLAIAAVLSVVAYAVWKFVLAGKGA